MENLDRDTSVQYLVQREKQDPLRPFGNPFQYRIRTDSAQGCRCICRPRKRKLTVTCSSGASIGRLAHESSDEAIQFETSSRLRIER
jgi:hypothetical protein